jgi:hypothetical protein
MSQLYGKLARIGFRVTAEEVQLDFVDIEKTLIEGLYEVDQDSRLLGLIFSWAKVHSDHLIADKFLKLYKEASGLRGECPWVSALCAYLVHLKKHRFAKGIKKFDSEIWSGGRKLHAALKMDGAIDYLSPLNIFIPKGHLRIREGDILTVKELIETNPQYKNRFIYGANWRSEIITTIQRGFENPYQISKELKIGYSRAWIVFHEYQLVSK